MEGAFERGRAGGGRRSGRLATAAVARARAGARGFLQSTKGAGVDPAPRRPGGSAGEVAWQRQRSTPGKK